MSPETSEFVKSIIPVLSAIFGTIVGVAGTILATYINGRSEERKHLRTLSFNAGIETFKESINLAIAQNKKASILPLEIHILNMGYLLKILQKKDVDKEGLKKLIIEKNKLIQDVTLAVIEADKENSKPNK